MNEGVLARGTGLQIPGKVIAADPAAHRVAGRQRLLLITAVATAMTRTARVTVLVTHDRSNEAKGATVGTWDAAAAIGHAPGRVPSPVPTPATATAATAAHGEASEGATVTVEVEAGSAAAMPRGVRRRRQRPRLRSSKLWRPWLPRTWTPSCRERRRKTRQRGCALSGKGVVGRSWSGTVRMRRRPLLRRYLRRYQQRPRRSRCRHRRPRLPLHLHLYLSLHRHLHWHPFGPRRPARLHPAHPHPARPPSPCLPPPCHPCHPSPYRSTSRR